MLMNDRWILEQCFQHKMIDPFAESLTRKDVLSWGLSSFGYDVRLASKFLLFTNGGFSATPMTIDPKNFDPTVCKIFEDVKVFRMPPRAFVLASTMEYIRMPPDATAMMKAKSTYARCGVIIPPTVMEPGWEGAITLEFYNATPQYVKLYPGEGVGQLMFFTGEMPMTTYADRNGKYQGQQGITLPKV